MCVAVDENELGSGKRQISITLGACVHCAAHSNGVEEEYMNGDRSSIVSRSITWQCEWHTGNESASQAVHAYCDGPLDGNIDGIQSIVLRHLVLLLV